MIKLFGSAILFFWTSASLHPLHVSVTEINFDPNDKALEIMVRVFVDDLETAMRERHNLPELDITKPAPRSLDELMREYLAASLQVTIDGKRQSLNYLGHEREGEAFVFYVEVQKVKKLKEVTVRNSILTEIFEDQSNLVHVTSAGTVKSLRLNKHNQGGTLSFGE